MAGAETPGDTSPRFLGQQPQHPGGFPQQGHGQYTPGGTSCLLSGWSGRHCPGTEGIQRPARGQGGLSRARGAAPGPPALLGPPRAHPGTRAWTQAGGPARPAGQTAPPGGRAQAGTLTTAGTRQSSGTPRLPRPRDRTARGSSRSALRPLLRLWGSPFTKPRRLEVHGSPVKQEEDTSQAGCGQGARSHTHENACTHTGTHKHPPHRRGLGADSDRRPRVPNHENSEGSCLNPRTHLGSDISAGKGGFQPTSELGLRVHHKAAPGACGPAALAGPPGALLQPAQEWSEGPPGPVRALRAPHSTARVLPAAPQLWGSQRTRAAPCSKP